MGRVLVDWLMGAAVIAAPQHQLTITAGAAAIQGVRALAGAARERKQRRQQQREREEAAAASDNGAESGSTTPASSAAPSRAQSASVLSSCSAAATPTKKSSTSNGDFSSAGSSSNVTRPVDLVWCDLTVLVPDKAAAAAAASKEEDDNKKSKKRQQPPKKRILSGVSGVAAAGRLCAIMGPSGSGKTTLLHALAGQLARAPGVEAKGSIVALVPVRRRNKGAATEEEDEESEGSDQRSLARSPPRVAFVQQSDEFFSMLTVRETLELAARLRSDEGAPASEIAATAEALMRRLGLAKVADARVGGGRARGLSGGERKRLSIACELVGSPAVLFADEPTSGLDSFQAERVVAALSDLAKEEGRTVVASVHQPRSSAFALFDDLVLLAEGKIAYSGPAAGALPYFESAEGGGHRCPEHFNPAEFLADLVSIDHGSSEAEEASRARVKGITDAWEAKQAKERDAGTGVGGGGSARNNNSNSSNNKKKSAAGAESATAATLAAARQLQQQHSKHHHKHRHQQQQQKNHHRTSFLTQLALLGKRAWRQTSRDRATAAARAASSLSSALIFGSIYWRLGKTQASIQDRMGLLQVSAINAAMSALVKTLNAFPRERAIVERERTSSGDGGYSVLPYFLAKLSAEAPLGAAFPLLFGAAVYPSAGLNPSPLRFAKFCGVLSLEALTSTAMGLAVGAAAPSADAAMAIGPAVTVIFIVFGGVYVSGNGVPRWLRWVPRASFIKHAFEGLVVNEFAGMEFEPATAAASFEVPSKKGGGGPPPFAKGGKKPGSSSGGGGGGGGGAGGPGDLLTGSDVLRRFGLGGATVRSTCRAQCRVLAFHCWTTLCLLRARSPKYLSPTPVSDDDVAAASDVGGAGVVVEEEEKKSV